MSVQSVPGAAAEPSGERVECETLAYSLCAARVAAFRNLNRDAARSPEYFRWRYEGRPCQQGGYVSWALDEQGQAMGAASCIAHEFFVLGARRVVGVVGDISVLPSCRGRGVARQVLAELRGAAAGRGLSACFVLPNPEVTGSLRRAGWVTVAALAREVRVLSLRSRLARRFGRAGEWLAACVDPLFSTPRRGGARGEGYELAPANDFSADVDGLWERFEKGGRVLAVRNQAYLRWRFLAKPGADYRLLELRRWGELCGYLVHHLDGSMACVDDFFASDAAAARVLGGEFVRLVRSGAWAESIQARFVAATGLPVPWRGAGFVRRADTQLVMWADPEPSGAISPEAWFVTPGDKDV